MANPESSDQTPDSPSDDRGGVAEASPTAIANETAQLQQLLAESKEGEREARRALSVLASIIKHLPVGVTVQRRAYRRLCQRPRGNPRDGRQIPRRLRQ